MSEVLSLAERLSTIVVEPPMDEQVSTVLEQGNHKTLLSVLTTDAVAFARDSQAELLASAPFDTSCPKGVFNHAKDIARKNMPTALAYTMMSEAASRWNEETIEPDTMTHNVDRLALIATSGTLNIICYEARRGSTSCMPKTRISLCHVILRHLLREHKEGWKNTSQESADLARTYGDLVAAHLDQDAQDPNIAPALTRYIRHLYDILDSADAPVWVNKEYHDRSMIMFGGFTCRLKKCLYEKKANVPRALMLELGKLDTHMYRMRSEAPQYGV